ncbi:MAG: tyrosine--tRNA ligase [Candidatus Bipolaricaulota bacterium]|nr:tyrosine--tRNA ligase [Candidatus Bipolaricaulota bacterium]MDW8111247.1 tyrosine--tRNA ligase [Candidatus Bipolaricaulota bacterium]
MKTLSVEEQLRRLKRRAVEIIPEADLVKKLERAARTGKPLRVKLGVDPTSPDIHIAIGVVLQKLRDFQDCGHTAVLIIGDFTARIGDPSGRSAQRKMLSKAEIEANMQRYKEQALKILDPERLEFRYNSEWLEGMSFDKLLELASRYTVAAMLEREDFAKRFQAGTPISIVEFLYPLAQAYDSVAIQADVELGGEDQRFNLLIGRAIQERYGQEPQVCFIAAPVLEGIDGVKKMSKSFGNYVGVTEPPHEMFGKLMSIPDTLIERYVTFMTDLDWEALKKLHPKEQKQRLAHAIVTRYHGQAAADAALAEFERVFARKERPTEVPKVHLDRSALKPNGTVWIVDLIAPLAKSRSEAKRLIEQGAVEVDGVKIVRTDQDVPFRDGLLVKVGKHTFAELYIQ